jgi:Zn-dependent protease with chaperone function
LINALKKISKDSVIEAVWDKGTGVAAMCIYEARYVESFKWIREIFSTHPSIENRIELLEKY